MSMAAMEAIVVILGPVTAFVYPILAERREEPVAHAFLSIVALIYGIGMFIGSFLFSIILIGIFSLELAVFNLVVLLLPVLVVSLVATIVEAISPKNLDNWTVPVAVFVVIAIISYALPLWWPFGLFTL